MEDEMEGRIWKIRFRGLDMEGRIRKMKYRGRDREDERDMQVDTMTVSFLKIEHFGHWRDAN